MFDLGLLIEKQTRVPTEFYDDRSIEEDFKSNSESFKGGKHLDNLYTAYR